MNNNKNSESEKIMMMMDSDVKEVVREVQAQPMAQESPASQSQTVYERLLTLFLAKPDSFRILSHAAEGRTDEISRIRGNKLSQAAKAMILMVKTSKKDRIYVLAVVPGDRKVDLKAISKLFDNKETRFAPADKAVSLSECQVGAVPPFSFNPDLKLIVDSALIENSEIVFNAGVLDKSVFLKSDFYKELAKPQIESISLSADGIVIAE